MYSTRISTALRCMVETNTTLSNNHTPIKKKRCWRLEAGYGWWKWREAGGFGIWVGTLTADGMNMGMREGSGLSAWVDGVTIYGDGTTGGQGWRVGMDIKTSILDGPNLRVWEPSKQFGPVDGCICGYASMMEKCQCQAGVSDQPGQILAHHLPALWLGQFPHLWNGAPNITYTVGLLYWSYELIHGKSLDFNSQYSISVGFL